MTHDHPHVAGTDQRATAAKVRRNTRGTYRIITRRNRPLVPRKHFRGGLHDAETGGDSCELSLALELIRVSVPHGDRLAHFPVCSRSIADVSFLLTSPSAKHLHLWPINCINTFSCITTWVRSSRLAPLSIVGGKRLSYTRYRCHWSLSCTPVVSDKPSDLPSIFPIDRFR
jgi:hypothetical protein